MLKCFHFLQTKYIRILLLYKIKKAFLKYSSNPINISRNDFHSTFRRIKVLRFPVDSNFVRAPFLCGLLTFLSFFTFLDKTPSFKKNYLPHYMKVWIKFHHFLPKKVSWHNLYDQKKSVDSALSSKISYRVVFFMQQHWHILHWLVLSLQIPQRFAL